MQHSVGSAVVTGSGDEPSPEDVERWYRARQQPENEVPVALPVTAVLARTASLAVVVTSLQACTTGFSFQVVARLRRSPAPGEDVYGQFTNTAGAGGRFLLGVEFADGRRTSVLDEGGAWPPPPPGPEAGVSISGVGGGGGGRSYEQGWWVTPLPPEGPLRLVVRWDAQGLAETVVELDGAAVAAAGRSAVVLWPWEPDAPAEDRGADPVRPADGWFARP